MYRRFIGVGASIASASQNRVGSVQSPKSSHEFSATLTTTGAVKKTEKFADSLLVGGSSSFGLNWNVSKGFKGPGTYTNPKGFQDSVELTAPAGQFDPLGSSVLSVKVDANGSGEATFKNLEDAYSNAFVSGTEKWTCS